MEQWSPYLYVYGIGGIVFFIGLWLSWRSGALKDKRLGFLLLGGFAFYALLHALLQGSGAPGEMPVTGKERGADGILLSTVDIVVLVSYFAIVISVGAYFARFTRTSTDFFFGGRRFKGWLVALSCVATTIGSYSFIKYASVGYRFGLSSTMSYLNDWFWMPLWMLVWLPIIFYGRIRSVPEYFERRFGRKARLIAVFILVLFLMGYISINFLTLGKAINILTGWPIFLSACMAAVGTAIYVAVGGQTSVIMTDLAQSLLLLLVGIGLFVAGVYHLGGPEIFWNGLPDAHKMGLAPLNHPDSFHTMGVFWQDAMVGGIAFYFINQGIMMRFMSARNVAEGRKAIALVVLLVMPLAALSVSGVGWVARVMASTGEIEPMIDPDNVFVVVSAILAHPGVFGLIMAALVAALMSTVDTLVTATSAVVVNDIWRPYLGKGASDKTDLKVARITTVGASATGLSLVPVFMQFDSIYVAHAAFIAAVIPPMAVTLILGILWPKFGPRAAILTMLGGSFAVAMSMVFPDLIIPFTQGAGAGGEGMRAHTYMRALYGLSVSSMIAVVGVLIFKEKRSTDTMVLAGPEEEAATIFKGSALNPNAGQSIRLALNVVDDAGLLEEETNEVLLPLHPDDREKLGAYPGDMIIISAPGNWHGGLKSVHGRIAETDGQKAGVLCFPRELTAYAGLRHYKRVDVILEG